jgi:enoyl-[acyl-carrier protein] reductase II
VLGPYDVLVYTGRATFSGLGKGRTSVGTIAEPRTHKEADLLRDLYQCTTIPNSQVAKFTYRLNFGETYSTHSGEQPCVECGRLRLMASCFQVERDGPSVAERDREDAVLHTPVCDVLGVEVPIMQAAIWPATAPELVAAVSDAGGLGSIGSVFESAESVEGQIARVRELTSRPFAVNHVVPLLDEEAFKVTLEAEPAVISLALGDPGDLVERAHAAGAKVVHQVHTVAQARRVAELAVDVIIAQGSEAGGQGLSLGVGAMALIPQVVDAVSPIPVLAAGAVADGRGLAAALVLGAQGANVGTRFLASEEASADESWKRTILATESEDVVKFEVWKEIFPPPSEGAYETAPRVMRTSFVEEWQRRPEAARREAERLRDEVMSVVRERRVHELVPFTGQTAGMIHAVLPASEIIRGMVSEAEEALRGATQFLD